MCLFLPIYSGYQSQHLFCMWDVEVLTPGMSRSEGVMNSSCPEGEPSEKAQQSGGGRASRRELCQSRHFCIFHENEAEKRGGAALSCTDPRRIFVPAQILQGDRVVCGNRKHLFSSAGECKNETFFFFSGTGAPVVPRRRRASKIGDIVVCEFLPENTGGCWTCPPKGTAVFLV